MGLMRLTADGVLDPLFDGDGMIAVDFDGNRDEANAVAIQPDGAIVAAGGSAGNSALLRVNRDGSLDSTFGDGGKSVIDLGGYSVLALDFGAGGQLACGHGKPTEFRASH